jgi:hypothetical protein
MSLTTCKYDIEIRYLHWNHSFINKAQLVIIILTAIFIGYEISISNRIHMTYYFIIRFKQTLIFFRYSALPHSSSADPIFLSFTFYSIKKLQTAHSQSHQRSELSKLSILYKCFLLITYNSSRALRASKIPIKQPMLSRFEV